MMSLIAYPIKALIVGGDYQLTALLEKTANHSICPVAGQEADRTGAIAVIWTGATRRQHRRRDDILDAEGFEVPVEVVPIRQPQRILKELGTHRRPVDVEPGAAVRHQHGGASFRVGVRR